MFFALYNIWKSFNNYSKRVLGFLYYYYFVIIIFFLTYNPKLKPIGI